jgi:hypothetical protein
MADAEPELPRLVAQDIPCFCCNQLGLLKCGGCFDARYCSGKCQKKDWRAHEHICLQFSLMEPRPGPNYYRGILFPDTSVKPKFVWVEYEQDKKDKVDFRRHVGDVGWTGWTKEEVPRDHKLDRTLKHSIRVRRPYGSVTGGKPDNTSLSHLLGIPFPKAYLARKAMAHGIGSDYQEDLDTSALSPILNYFRYNARIQAARFRKLAKEADRVANSET